ncbi:50S ribosomal protein L14 [candidate division WWE3 bacterium RIFCSPHIGHO2_01_FULL_48_15]|uniref:Large ribosomal subunit protein uL14 n=1 Tax=candidate division WWE3 bacterium RIFCSPHIGHO2_01_FULL_48_15 TaxID=1802619 RepID=A0A1F4V9Y7_UNCKA|nr:MAG: 50S ribosomal protein L14 [candidate division WWE3 bacterium RIFCSPHIGHO2_01_FULL_48_15]
MVQKETMLVAADNSGAKFLRVIGIPKKGQARFATVGDIVSVAVHGADPNGIVADHAKEIAVVVRVAKEVRRRDGSYVRFDDNAGVVIDKAGEPKGSRVLGPIAREVRERGYKRIASLAQEVW